MEIYTHIAEEIKQKKSSEYNNQVHFDDITLHLTNEAGTEESIYDSIEREVDFNKYQPKLIEGIEVFKVTRDNGSTPKYLLKHPKTNDFFDLTPDLFEIIRRFNGDYSIEELFVIYFELNNSFASEKIQNIVRLLDERGFLEHISENLYDKVDRKLSSKRNKRENFNNPQLHAQTLWHKAFR